MWFNSKLNTNTINIHFNTHSQNHETHLYFIQYTHTHSSITHVCNSLIHSLVEAIFKNSLVHFPIFSPINWRTLCSCIYNSYITLVLYEESRRKQLHYWFDFVIKWLLKINWNTKYVYYILCATVWWEPLIKEAYFGVLNVKSNRFTGWYRARDKYTTNKSSNSFSHSMFYVELQHAGMKRNSKNLAPASNVIRLETIHFDTMYTQRIFTKMSGFDEAIYT